MKINSNHSRLLVSAAVATAALTGACGNGLQSTAGADPALRTPTASATAPTTVAAPAPSRTPSTTPDPARKSKDPDATTSPTSTRTGVPATAKTSSRSGQTTCVTRSLRVGVRASEGGAAAGSNYVLLTFTNTSNTTCTLYGYAGVSFVGNGDGTQLGAPAVRVGSDRNRLVALAPGKTETELLKIANAGNFTASSCAPTTADGLRIYPPASTDASYVPFKTDACQRHGSAQLQVHPVGTSG